MSSDPCPTCQGRNRETTDMVCMTCGRDYLDDNPRPGLGWKRLMGAWREQCKATESDLAAARAEIERLTTLAQAETWVEAGVRIAAQTRRELAAAHAEMSVLTERLRLCNVDQHTTEADLAAARAENEMLRREYHDVAASGERQAQAALDAEADLAASRVELTNVQRSLQETHDQRNELQAELNAARAEITFEPVRVLAVKYLPCPGCGKTAKRRTTIQETLNPYNKNPDGTVKDYDQVLASVRAKADAWRAKPEFHEKCKPPPSSSRDTRVQRDEALEQLDAARAENAEHDECSWSRKALRSLLDRDNPYLGHQQCIPREWIEEQQ